MSQDTAPSRNLLLDPRFMGKVEQLTLVSRKIFRGRMRGERRSPRRGQSVEFADVRDFRRVAAQPRQKRKRLMEPLGLEGPRRLLEAPGCHLSPIRAEHPHQFDVRI